VYNGVITSERLRWVGHGARIRKTRNVYSILIGKQWKRLFGRPGCRWGDNIKMNLR
jgi:hypothetical protein